MPKVAMLFVTTTDIPIGDALVEVRLTRSDFDDKISGVLMNRLESFRTDANGELTVDLMTCRALYHVTVYDTEQDIAIHHDFYVPDAAPGEVLRLQDLIVPYDTHLSSFPFDETAMLAIIDARNAAQIAAVNAKASEVEANAWALASSASSEMAQTHADAAHASQVAVSASEQNVVNLELQVSTNAAAVRQDTIAAEAAKVASEANAEWSQAEAHASQQSAAEAAASKLNAATSAEAASTSATSASQSAANSEASKVQAGLSAGNALESARVAGLSATSSQNSANASAQSAAEAVATLASKLDKATAVYNPAPNSVPLAAANGRINNNWIDPTMPVYSEVPFSVGTANKFAINLLKNGGASQDLYKIATLAPNGVSTYSSLRIDAFLGGWGGVSMTAMEILMGSRGEEGFYVDWSSSRESPLEARIVAYKEDDGYISVYVFFLANSFTQASLMMMGMQATTYGAPVAVSSVPGQIVWDSAEYAGNIGYSAPRTIGLRLNAPGQRITGPLFSSTNGGDRINNTFINGAGDSFSQAGTEHESLGLGVVGAGGFSYPGRFSLITSSGHNQEFSGGYLMEIKAVDSGSGNYTPSLLSITGDGRVYMPLLKAGSTDPSTEWHSIARVTTQEGSILAVGRDGAPSSCMAIRGSDGQGGWNNAPSVMYLGKNGTTSRGLTTPGTVNAQGNDYAEYIKKVTGCAEILKGQIIGITADNMITDKWGDAVMFSIKSTDPSYVGGDTWATNIGVHPDPTAGVKPTAPVRRESVIDTQVSMTPAGPVSTEIEVSPGDTDEEWAARQAAYAQAVTEHAAAVLADKQAMDTFDAALEVERQKVDRIAIAGRVPVNVFGAAPGDYIIPIQQGDGIGGIAVKEDDMTLKQYLRAVGQVITVQEDGRAYVMVKSV